jgi:hypothetical protein
VSGQDFAQGLQSAPALRVRSHRDAQELLDARLAEVADDDAAAAQRGGEFAGASRLRMAGEDEVGGGGQHLEAERGEILHQRIRGWR